MTALVLYADDMEPITVIEVPPWAARRLAEGERIEFAVPEPLVGILSRDEPPQFAPLKRVTLWSERFVRKGQTHVFLFTRDEVNALKLDPADLPGQRAMAAERYRRAFIDGFLSALSKVR